MGIKDLKNPELQEKLKNVQTADELVALAKAEGVDLSEEQLDAISGGSWREGDTWCVDVNCMLLR